MNKLTITVNTHLIDKKKLTDRDYTNKEGKEVMVKELKLDVIPLKEKKLLKSGDTWKMIKVGFVIQSPTKEEKQAKTKMAIIGEVTEFESIKNEVAKEENSEFIPF